MKCRKCHSLSTNWAPGQYYCIGVKEPFRIDERDLDRECPAYPSKRDPEIPKEFDYVYHVWTGADSYDIHEHVTILDSYVHHFTGERFYDVRIESVSMYPPHGVVEHTTLEEDEIMRMLMHRKEK